MTEKDHEDFDNSNKSLICKKTYEKDEIKIKDYHHITGNY